METIRERGSGSPLVTRVGAGGLVSLLDVREASGPRALQEAGVGKPRTRCRAVPSCGFGLFT